MGLSDLPFHATVVKRLNMDASVKDWITKNPDNPVVNEFTIFFVWQCAKFDKGKFFMLEDVARRVKEEIRKQADRESFAKDATL